MIVVIRIKGDVGLKSEIRETLNRLRTRRKYSCIVINPTRVQLGMINKVKDFVAFGEINDEMFEKLIQSRGQKIDNSKEIDTKKIVEGVRKGKKYQDLNLKPFFRLHAPRGGIRSKLHFPKGVLGNNKNKIDKLLERML